jgi:hypothetical protein
MLDIETERFFGGSSSRVKGGRLSVGFPVVVEVSLVDSVLFIITLGFWILGVPWPEKTYRPFPLP